MSARFLLMLSLSACALPAHAYVLTPEEIKYTRSLLSRCNDGEGRSCFDYGRLLVQFDRQGDRRRAVQFNRRACILAYIPACNRPSPSEDAVRERNRCGGEIDKIVSLASLRSSDGNEYQQITRLSRGSVLERAGLKPGDVIAKMNGSELSSANDLIEALKQGRVLLDLSRMGTIVPLVVTCP